MEDRMVQKIFEFPERLAAEEKSRLEAAGTWADLELLTAEIGHLAARQLANRELSRLSKEIAVKGVQRFLDCRREFPVDPDPEPLLLQEIRRDLDYQEPRCGCPRRRIRSGSGARTHRRKRLSRIRVREPARKELVLQPQPVQAALHPQAVLRRAQPGHQAAHDGSVTGTGV